MDLTRRHALAAARPPVGPSLLLAVGITVAMLLAALAAGVRAPRPWWDRGAPPSEERVTYVAPPAAPIALAPPRAAAERPAAPPADRAARAPRLGPTVAPGAAAPAAASPDTGVGGRRAFGGRAGPAGGAAAAGAGAPGTATGPTLGSLRVGAERAPATPLTRAQKDSAAQAAMRAIFTPTVAAEAAAMAADATARRDAAARGELARAGAVSSNYGGLRLGAKIGFGGTSEKERARDAAADADTRARLAAVAERARRERADSTRRDSIRAARERLRP